MDKISLEILLADDDQTSAFALQQALSTLGHVVLFAGSGAMAIDMIGRRKPQLAIVSTTMPGEPDGAATAKQLCDAEIPLLLLSSSALDARKLLHLKPVGGLIKPFREGEIEMILTLAHSALKDQWTRKKRESFLSGVVNGMLDSVLVADPDRRIAFANSTASRTLQTADLTGAELSSFFNPQGEGNAELEAAIASTFGGATPLGSGTRATARTPAGVETPVIVIISSIKDSSGAVTGASLSFRAAPAARAPQKASTPRSVAEPESPAEVNESELPELPTNLLRTKAIKAIEGRLQSDQKNFALVLLLSQFDMFRMRYGLGGAEKLVHAFSAHLIKALPQEDRFYQWSSRTILVLLERGNPIDEVRIEMMAFCSRRVEYFLQDRSALVSLSASWNLIPLIETRDANVIADQIDAFEKLHTKRRA